MKRFSVFPAIFLLLLFGFSACFSPHTGEEGIATFTINVGDENGRWAYPPNIDGSYPSHPTSGDLNFLVTFKRTTDSYEQTFEKAGESDGSLEVASFAQNSPSLLCLCVLRVSA